MQYPFKAQAASAEKNFATKDAAVAWVAGKVKGHHLYEVKPDPFTYSAFVAFDVYGVTFKGEQRHSVSVGKVYHFAE